MKVLTVIFMFLTLGVSLFWGPAKAPLTMAFFAAACCCGFVAFAQYENKSKRGRSK